MARLIVSRSSEWSNKMRNIKLFVDKQEIGVIADGEIKAFDIAGGTHTFQAKIDWCSSPEIQVTANDNETKNIALSGGKLGKFLLPMLIAGILLPFHKRPCRYTWWGLPIPYVVFIFYGTHRACAILLSYTRA